MDWKGPSIQCFTALPKDVGLIVCINNLIDMNMLRNSLCFCLATPVPFRFAGSVKDNRFYMDTRMGLFDLTVSISE